MRLTYPDISLLTLAHQQGRRPSTLAITVGLLYGVDRQVLAAEHAQPWLSDRFDKQPLDSGLKKARGSFAVHGSAFPLTPQQQDSGMAVRVQVAAISKTLHVHPPRCWEHGVPGLTARACGPLAPLPLDFRHAFGGAGWACNPEGIGYLADPNCAIGMPLPQIENEHLPMRTPSQTLPIASFRPLPPQCLERRGLWGTCDRSWAARRAPFPPLDCDTRWFDEVGQDQCIAGYWTGNEDWSVEGMHPQQAQVSGTLPAFRARVFLTRTAYPGEIEEPTLHLDTIWLFPDVERVLLLYRAEVNVTDLDGADIEQLGAVYERDSAPVETAAAWCEKFWPSIKPAAVTMPTLPRKIDKEAIINRVRTSIDARYASFTAEQDKILLYAANLGERFGKTLNPADYQVTTPDLTALMQHAPIETLPFDPVALKACIHTRIDEAHAAAEKHLDQIAERLNMSAAALREKIKSVEQKSSGPAKAGPLSSLEQLPLPPPDKDPLRTKLSTGLQEMREVEDQINAKMQALQAALPTAHLAGLPPSPASAAVKGADPKSVPWTRALLEASHAAGDPLDGARFVGLDLCSIDLSGAKLHRCLFDNCLLTDSRWAGADLTGSTFKKCDLTAIDGHLATFDHVLMQDCRLENANLVRSLGENMVVRHCLFTMADLQGVVWLKGLFVGCDWVGVQAMKADLSICRLQGCDLRKIDLRGAQLGKTNLDDCQLDNALLTNTDLQSAVWSRVKGRDIDLTHAKASGLQLDMGCQLPGIRLDNADLSKASFQGVSLADASLRGTQLQNALLSQCDLRSTHGYHLDARHADFTGSNLSQIQWVGANLQQACLRKVRLEQADLRDSNLHAVASEGALGFGVRLEGALLSHCRLPEELENV